MPVISFNVTAEQKEEADAYALAKGYGRASQLARVAMFQMMSRYPKTGRHASDASEVGKGGKGQQAVLPEGHGGQETGGPA